LANGPVRTWFRQRVWSWNQPDACCNGTVSSGVPMTEGAPAVGAPAVIAPAPAATPGSALPPPTEVAPQLEPAPSAAPGPTPSSGTSGTGTSGSQGARSPAGKVNYEAARPRYLIGRSRGSGGPLRSFVQRTPSPTYRSAQGVAVASGTPAPARAVERRSSELSTLENLPPLDLPRDVTRSDVRTAAAAAETAPTPTTLPPPVEGAGTETPQPGVSTPPAEVSVAPGLKRFAAVEPKLAGGSLPSADGLDWLREKGYKTLVDLREPGEIQPSFLTEVSRRGLRYISLPISLTTVDRDHVTRFEFEISLADARPLYFFDTDGNRAGMLWYLHRMTDERDSYDAEEALRQAAELGLGDDAFKNAAQTYLDRLKKAAAPGPSSAPAAPATPAPAPAPRRANTTRVPASSAATSEPASVGASKAPAGARAVLPDQTTIPEQPQTIALPDAATLDLARATPPRAAAAGDNPPTADPNAWRPYLAMVFAAMGVPLAYCGRSLIQFRGLLRASLPAPGRRLRSLPGESGE
jgi:protein tyrosine phosphatase (PTP) superfamily phosphohydrolase (DUF442 family)